MMHTDVNDEKTASNTAALTSAVREVWGSGQRDADQFVARVARLLLDDDIDISPEIIAARLEWAISDAAAKQFAAALRALPPEDPRWLSLGDAVRHGGLVLLGGRKVLVKAFNRGLIARRAKPGQTWRYSLADVVRFVSSVAKSSAHMRRKKGMIGGHPIEWWIDQDDGTEPSVNAAERCGVSKDIIYRERLQRGMIKRGASTISGTSKTVVREPRSRPEVLETPPKTGVRRARRRPVDRIIDAVGQLVDAGVLSAEDGLAMLRKRR